MKNARQIHLFLGTFFAPMIIFFAFSGILQLFGLHESEGKEAPPPVAWIAALGDIHKNQRLRVTAPPPDEAHAVDDDHHAHDEHQAPVHTRTASPQSAMPSWALKAFVLLMAIGLIGTSLIGITIALQNPRTRRNAWIALALGAAVPIVLLYL